MKLDILAFGAHPDDVELGCGGTILTHLAKGKKVGIIDLTRGELGTRGNAVIRGKEAEEAAKILGVTIRENLGFTDGFFANDALHQMAVIRKIRAYKPDIVLASAVEDRHPDHARSAFLIKEACFLAGLPKIGTVDLMTGKTQKAWRPKAVYHYVQSTYQTPDFVVDITENIDKKLEAIKAYKSQFFVENVEAEGPNTYISDSAFIESVYGRARDLGKQTGFGFAEAFTKARMIGVTNLFDLV